MAKKKARQTGIRRNYQKLYENEKKEKERLKSDLDKVIRKLQEADERNVELNTNLSRQSEENKILREGLADCSSTVGDRVIGYRGSISKDLVGEVLTKIRRKIAKLEKQAESSVKVIETLKGIITDSLSRK